MIPQDDAVEPSDDYVVLGLTESVAPAESGGDHVTESGTRIRAGLGSQLVQLSFFGRDDAETLFDAIDDVSARIGGAATADPAWPLAMSLLLRADEYPDAAEFTGEVILAATPAAVAADPELAAAATSVVGEVVGHRSGRAL